MPSRVSCLSALLLLTAGSGLAAADSLSSGNNGPVALSLSAESVQGHANSLSRRNADIMLSNISSVAYLVTCTPGQKVKVVVDTGSDELWVNPICNNMSQDDDGADQKQCEASGHYSPSSSSTSKNLNIHGHIQYGKGRVLFDYYNDTVTQPDSGITLKDLQFGVATESTDLYEGILGLGFGKNNNYTTFVSAVAQQNAAGGPGKVFSVGLASANQANAGTLVLGGLDTNRFTGKLMPVPILAPPASDTLVRYWVKLDSIGLSNNTAGGSSSPNNNSSNNGNRAGSKTYPSSGGPIVLDTGSTLSILPASIISALAQDLGATDTTNQANWDELSSGLKADSTSSADSSSPSSPTTTANIFPVPCSAVGLSSDVHSKDNQAGLQRTIDFSFNNGAALIRVPLSEFAVKYTSKYCLLGALAVDTSSSSSGGGGSGSGGGGLDPDVDITMLLGATFLRGAYIVFDQSANSVYMAPYASCNGGAANLQPLASAPPGAANGMSGACSVADSLFGGGAGGFAAAAASPPSSSGNGSGSGSGSGSGGASDGSKKNAGPRSSSLSTASLVFAVISVALVLLFV